MSSKKLEIKKLEIKHQNIMESFLSREGITEDEKVSVKFVDKTFTGLMEICGTLRDQAQELQDKAEQLKLDLSKVTKDKETVARDLSKVTKDKEIIASQLRRAARTKKTDDDLIAKLQGQKQKDDDLIHQLQGREQMLKKEMKSFEPTYQRYQRSGSELNTQIESIASLLSPDPVDVIEATVAKPLQGSEVDYTTRTPPVTISTDKVKSFDINTEKAVSFDRKANLPPTGGLVMSSPGLESLFAVCRRRTPAVQPPASTSTVSGFRAAQAKLKRGREDDEITEETFDDFFSRPAWDVKQKQKKPKTGKEGDESLAKNVKSTIKSGK